ncbi:hypothetical protein Q31b_36980 [Novipirellula aureliae]|uniref:Uncharacterized protein n=1 Tax=Novipirellula aureliae TaxID=2527966 RepID=A0A5C6DZL7_9BACT|nr:hypothetical protein [Novipirellula aureliae]TWU40349.1 hypothetical protein Q31b_36980 [Novipirellula aureliae]
MPNTAIGMIDKSATWKDIMNANQSTTKSQAIASHRSANFNSQVKWLAIVFVALIAFEWKKSSDLPLHDTPDDRVADAASANAVIPAPEVAAPRREIDTSYPANRTVSNKQNVRENVREKSFVSQPVSVASRPRSEDSSKPTMWLPKPKSTPDVQTVSLPYATSLKSQTESRAMLDQATREYQVGASLSAETSAWQSLVDTAEAIAIASKGQPPKLGYSAPDPRSELQLARTALLEARDFANQNQASANRQISLDVIVKSHQTETLHSANLSKLSATQAIEIYLDEARNRFASLAAQNRLAAEAMDLLAAIYLTRNDPATMPTSTSLCLRRAALEGQPDNASLASSLGFQLAKVGLLEESRRVLSHSLSLRYDLDTQMALVHVLRSSGQPQQAAELERSYREASQRAMANRNRKPIPNIERLSPAEFAAVSRPVMPATRIQSIQSNGQGNHLGQAEPSVSGQPVSGQLVSNRMGSAQATPFGFASQSTNRSSEKNSGPSSANQDGSVQADKPNLIRNAFESMTKWW